MDTTCASAPTTKGFRAWFLVALLLLAGLGPVVGSEKWGTWDEGRKYLKVLNWGITAAISLACFWCLRVPGIRSVMRVLRVVPWLLAFASLFMLFVYSRGIEPVATLCRAGYAAISASVWFLFFNRFSTVLSCDQFTEAAWQELICKGSASALRRDDPDGGGE